MNDYSRYAFSREERVLFYGVMVITGILISLLMYHNILCSVIILPFIGKIRVYVEEFLAEKRKREYMKQFKDFLFLISTSIGAGRGMPEAIEESIPGLEEIYGKNSLLVNELEIVSNRVNNNQEDEVNVLMELGIHSGIGDVIDFAMIYKVCRQTGANLVSSLNKSSSMIIDKMTIEKEITEIVRRKESEGLIIFVMPIIVILFLNLTSPDYVAPLYETLTGHVIMTLVIIADIAIYGVIRRITRIVL